MIERTEYKADVKQYRIVAFEDKMVLNQPTGNFFYDPWELKEEYKGTMWEELLKTLPVNHGEARLIKMKPGTTYMAHADIDDRWHLSLQGQQSYLIDLDNKEMHLLEQDGYWYNMDAGRLHVASNFGSYDRLQLVVRQLLKSTEMTDLVNITIEPSRLQHDYRYKFDSIISPWLNRLNKTGFMKDFSYVNSIVNFNMSESKLEELNFPDYFNIEINSI
jgi:hypothetical protein